MEMGSIVDIISNVGFPIACVIYMGWLNYNQTKSHREESAKLAEALNNNTIALAELKGIINASK